MPVVSETYQNNQNSDPSNQLTDYGKMEKWDGGESESVDIKRE